MFAANTMDSQGFVFLLKALLCVGTTALGSLPIALVGDMTDIQMGTSISVAAGMMTGCSVVLAVESFLSSSFIHVLTGVLVGICMIHAIDWLLAGREDLSFGDLKGSSAAGGLIIFFSLVLHSFGEGLSIGVSATQPMHVDQHSGLNMVVLISLAIHNIPEGMAVCMAYRSKGMSMKRASVCAFMSSLPQPMSALASFCCMQHLGALEFAVPIGLGVASGAMACVVVKELAPEALEKVSSKQAVPVMIVSGLVVLSLDAFIHFGCHDASTAFAAPIYANLGQTGMEL
jgi:zinc transporter ZupT